MNNSVGFDRLHLSFPISLDLEVIAQGIFGLPLSSFTQRPRALNWYAKSYLLMTSAGNCLAAIHTGPDGEHNQHNYVQLHGLILSDSALNALRPFSVERVLEFARLHRGNITQLDLILDSHEPVPFKRLRQEAKSDSHRRYIQSPFLRGVVPQVFDHGIYIGLRPRRHKEVNGKLQRIKSSSCMLYIYNKRESGRQRINEADNQLKYPWYRFEIRFKGAAARSVGMALLDYYDNMDAFCHEADSPVLDLDQFIALQFRHYLRFIKPSATRARRCKLQPWYEKLLNQFIPEGTPDLTAKNIAPTPSAYFMRQLTREIENYAVL